MHEDFVEANSGADERKTRRCVAVVAAYNCEGHNRILALSNSRQSKDVGTLAEQCWTWVGSHMSRCNTFTPAAPERETGHEKVPMLVVQNYR